MKKVLAMTVAVSMIMIMLPAMSTFAGASNGNGKAIGKQRVEEAKVLNVTPGKVRLVEKLEASTTEEINRSEWVEKSVQEIQQTIKTNRTEPAPVVLPEAPVVTEPVTETEPEPEAEVVVPEAPQVETPAPVTEDNTDPAAPSPDPEQPETDQDPVSNPEDETATPLLNDPVIEKDAADDATEADVVDEVAVVEDESTGAELEAPADETAGEASEETPPTVIEAVTEVIDSAIEVVTDVVEAVVDTVVEAVVDTVVETVVEFFTPSDSEEVPAVADELPALSEEVPVVTDEVTEATTEETIEDPSSGEAIEEVPAV